MSDTAERIPAEVWPLASFLAEEMEERGWTTDDVALRMRDDPARDVLLVGLVLIVSHQRDSLLITDDLFRKLARAFGVSEDLFRGLDAEWRKHPESRVAFECPEELLGPMFRAGFPSPPPHPGGEGR